jgi:hypothetical protein
MGRPCLTSQLVLIFGSICAIRREQIHEPAQSDGG